MKRSVKATLACLLIAVLCFAFTACSMLSGTYRTTGIAETYISCTFKWNTVTINTYVLGNLVGTFEGNYEIKDDNITITFSEDPDNAEAEQLSGTQSFEKGDDYIKIGVLTLNKSK